MTTADTVMRYAETWQVSGAMYGDEADGRVGAATAASRSDAVVGQDAGASSARSWRDAADGIHVEACTRCGRHRRAACHAYARAASSVGRRPAAGLRARTA